MGSSRAPGLAPSPGACAGAGAQDAVIQDNEVEGVWGTPNPPDVIRQQGAAEPAAGEAPAGG